MKPQDHHEDIHRTHSGKKLAQTGLFDLSAGGEKYDRLPGRSFLLRVSWSLVALDFVEKNLLSGLFFAAHWQSPISMEKRAIFGGLRYYPPDLNFRFELELHEHSNKEKIQIEDTKGAVRQFLRWGEFRFNVGNESCVLQAYKSAPEEQRLFVPFRDTTSGKETYGAGRYLDLDSRDRTANGKWILDFNRAYSPWCAYSEDYACPFVPPENRLKVPMKAGEKT